VKIQAGGSPPKSHQASQRTDHVASRPPGRRSGFNGTVTRTNRTGKVKKKAASKKDVTEEGLGMVRTESG
jgi:hypothetical protein